MQTKIVNSDNINNLRKQGVKVRVLHLRRVIVPQATTKGIKNIEHLYSRSEIEELIARNVVHHVSPIGGFTRVEITTPDGQVYKGISESKRDIFNRKVALHVALGRAVKAMKG